MYETCRTAEGFHTPLFSAITVECIVVRRSQAFGSVEAVGDHLEALARLGGSVGQVGKQRRFSAGRFMRSLAGWADGLVRAGCLDAVAARRVGGRERAILRVGGGGRGGLVRVGERAIDAAVLELQPAHPARCVLVILHRSIGCRTQRVWSGQTSGRCRGDRGVGKRDDGGSSSAVHSGRREDTRRSGCAGEKQRMWRRRGKGGARRWRGRERRTRTDR